MSGSPTEIQKTMAAQILSELNAVNMTNGLFEQYTTDFATFCKSPGTASKALIQQIHNRRWDYYSDLKQNWGHPPPFWDEMTQIAKSHQLFGHMPKPELAERWAYDPPP